jgi:hypothetical protein
VPGGAQSRAPPPACAVTPAAATTGADAYFHGRPVRSVPTEAGALPARLPKTKNADRSRKRHSVSSPLFSEASKNRKYQPLDSVWYGEEDAELLEELLKFYPHRAPRLILDATVNGGRFWRGSARPVIGLDIDPKHRPNICADNTAMPFQKGIFDVVVYDPPHIPNQGRDRSKDFNSRFGLGTRSDKENGYTFAHTYPAFMAEAWRVLTKDGILLCKIVDYVHNHRYQWAHVDLIRAGQEVGFTACDCIIKVRKGPIIDPKWKMAHHTRRQHCYWIIFRKSERCEKAGETAS